MWYHQHVAPLPNVSGDGCNLYSNTWDFHVRVFRLASLDLKSLRTIHSAIG